MTSEFPKTDVSVFVHHFCIYRGANRLQIRQTMSLLTLCQKLLRIMVLMLREIFVRFIGNTCDKLSDARHFVHAGSIMGQCSPSTAHHNKSTREGS